MRRNYWLTVVSPTSIKIICFKSIVSFKSLFLPEAGIFCCLETKTVSGLVACYHLNSLGNLERLNKQMVRVHSAVNKKACDGSRWR
jgi:hypothetical protein